MVDVHGSEVSIAAELKRESEEKQGKQLRTERVYGMQRRSFTLASEVDEDKVVARYADGVLSLVLPKRPAGQQADPDQLSGAATPCLPKA
jgi:HSP20 family protein